MKPRKVIVEEGEEYNSISEACRKYGIKNQMFTDRVKCNWSIKEALGIVERDYKSILPDDVVSGKVKMIDIAEYEGLFGILEDGRCWRYYSFGVKGGWVKPVLDRKCPVPVYCLFRNGIRKTISICKLVADAFIPNPNNYSKAEHVNGDIHNSNTDNVRWKPSGNECTVNGEIFESEFKAAKHYKINHATFKSRRKNGWTLEESLGLKIRIYESNKIAGLIYAITDKTNGRKYIGQTKTTLSKRFKAHIAQSFKGKSLNKNGVLHAIKTKGKERFSIELVEKVEDINCLNEREIYHIKEMNTLHPFGYNIKIGGGAGRYSNKIRYNGKEYAGYSDIAKSHGVDPDTFCTRIHTGRTIAQALGVSPVKNTIVNKRISLLHNGITYNSTADAAVKLGIPRTTLASRIGRGMSLSEAIDYKHVYGKKAKFHPITVCGIQYKSKKEAATVYGVKPSVFIKRMKEGWKVEEALNIKPRLQWYESV